MHATAGPEPHDPPIKQLAPVPTIDGPQQSGYSVCEQCVNILVVESFDMPFHKVWYLSHGPLPLDPYAKPSRLSRVSASAGDVDTGLL